MRLLCCPRGTGYAYADEHTRKLLKRRDETQKEIEMLSSSINSLQTKLSVMSVDLQGHPLFERTYSPGCLRCSICSLLTPVLCIESVRETVKNLVEEEKKLKRSNKTLKKLITAIEMDDPNYQM